MALDNPTLVGYKPFYIQVNSSLYDTKTEWGLIAKSNPYPALPSAKEPYSNDWKDENGEDEYTEHIYYESFEFSVGFYIRAKDTTNGQTAEEIVRSKIAAFFNVIKDGEFAVYDAYTALGRRKVRYASYKEDKFISRKGTARCMFTVTFKCNDPVTLMALNSNGTAIEEVSAS